jgi:hypothetical protein
MTLPTSELAFKSPEYTQTVLLSKGLGINRESKKETLLPRSARSRAKVKELCV